MAEATYTSHIAFGLRNVKGRGGKLITGNFQVSDTETITTGFDTIYSVNATPIEGTGPTSVFKMVEIKSVSAGVITLTARQVTLTEATDASRVLGASTDTDAYISIAGIVR